jgi:hypothetical protein
MAEAVVLVCDDCGTPATESVSFRIGGRSLRKDLCSRHLAALLKNARASKRGRPRGKATSTRSKTSKSAGGSKSRAKRRRAPGRKRAA